jgi:hypothetical protein
MDTRSRHDLTRALAVTRFRFSIGTFFLRAACAPLFRWANATEQSAYATPSEWLGQTEAGDVPSRQLNIDPCALVAESPSRSSSLTRAPIRKAKRRPAQMSNEERIAAVLVVVLLAALVGSVCFAYFLHHDGNAHSRTPRGQAPQTSPVQRLPMANRRAVRITMASVSS